MFDEVTVEAPHNEAIDPAVRSAVFQTYDLDNMMWEYRITAAGRLMCTPVVLQRVAGAPADTRKDTIEQILGRFQAVDLPEKQIDFHGDIELSIEHDGKWYTYKARFTDGVLSWIKPVENE